MGKKEKQLLILGTWYWERAQAPWAKLSASPEQGSTMLSLFHSMNFLETTSDTSLNLEKVIVVY